MVSSYPTGCAGCSALSLGALSWGARAAVWGDHIVVPDNEVLAKVEQLPFPLTLHLLHLRHLGRVVAAGPAPLISLIVLNASTQGSWYTVVLQAVEWLASVSPDILTTYRPRWGLDSALELIYSRPKYWNVFLRRAVQAQLWGLAQQVALRETAALVVVPGSVPPPSGLPLFGYPALALPGVSTDF